MGHPELAELQKIFNDDIPIAGLMGAQAVRWDSEKVMIKAPFQKNKNHKNSVFGGSVHALLTLCGWAWVSLCLKRNSIQASVVIQSSEASYNRPMLQEFFAECISPSPENEKRFLHTLKKKGIARIKVRAFARVDGEHAAEFSGNYVAIVQKE